MSYFVKIAGFVVISVGGLEPESQYKYKGVDEKCELDKADIKVYINGSVNITSDESSKCTSWSC